MNNLEENNIHCKLEFAVTITKCVLKGLLEQLEENEPYATKSMDYLRNALDEVQLIEY